MTYKRSLVLIFILICIVLPLAADDFQAFDIGPDTASSKVLVVMEKTEFKLAVLRGISDAYADAGVQFHVEPFQVYSDVNESEWDAIIIMAPVYSDKVAKPTLDFLDGLKNTAQVFLIATSGNADFSMESTDVDAISSVSLKATQSEIIVARVVAALENRL